MPAVAFVTYEKLPDGTDDDRLAIAALSERGVMVQPAVWSSDRVDWQAFDGIVFRSPWDYFKRFEAFQNWLGSIENMGLHIWNPSRVIRWNAEKTYLHDLARRGVNTVPTTIIEQHAPRSLEAILRDHGWPKAVVKPAVSADAYETWMTDPSVARDDQPSFESLLKKSNVLIQPFVPEITQQGEWSLIFFNRVFSHAMLKKPRPGDFRVQQHYGGTVVAALPSHDLIAQAAELLTLIDDPLLYARVDAISVKGKLMLMELEVFEPSLFFGAYPESAERFADALLTLLV